MRGGVKAVRLAGSENKQSASPLALNNVISSQHRLFFLGDHAPGNENRPALLLMDLFFEPRPESP